MPSDAPKTTNFDIIHIPSAYRKLWYSMPLDVPGMANFDIIHIPPDWRKLWYSMPLDMPRMASSDIIHIPHHWWKFWYSMPSDAPRKTNSDAINILPGWKTCDIQGPLLPLERLSLILFTSPLVIENCNVHPLRCTWDGLFWYYSYSPLLKKILIFNTLRCH